jgi:type IV pilus assembly protein PilW
MEIGRHKGMTLVELMVGLVLGLMIIGVVITVFVNANRNFRQDQLIGRMQENARYAMRMIATDLSMVGFWGPLIDSSAVNAQVRNCKTGSDPGDATKCGGFFENSVLDLAVADDCGPGTGATAPANWAYDMSRFVEVANESSADDAESTFTCIDNAEFLADTDILAIKRLRGRSLDATRGDDDDDGKVFLRTNGDAAMILRYDNEAAAPPGAEDWEYLVHIYYIRDHFMSASDAIPTLFRKQLSAGSTGIAMDTETGGVAQGIEYVHVMFGIDRLDTPSDGVPDYYIANPGSAEMRAAVTAKIYVLVRSINPDPLYTNSKSYQLGDVTKSFADDPDNFYRRVFTTTVQLRNRVNLKNI